MRLRVSDRILVGIAGVLLLAACAGMVAQMFFSVDLISMAAGVFSNDSGRARAALIGFAALLLLLGIYCVLVLFRHRKRKDKFILQKNDSGELAISVKALENMVQKCLEQHDELTVQHLYLENKKDGLLIRIRGSVAGGISIPLTVEALQKQIRQYVTACSGVEVKGIRVQIESSGEDAKNAPFAIAAPSAKPLLKEAEEKQTPVQTAETQENTAPVQPAQDINTSNSAAAAETPAVQTVPDEDDDRPLHQRLFSSPPEPCIVPEPPADAGRTAEDRKDEAETVEEPASESVENAEAEPSHSVDGSAETDDGAPVIPERTESGDARENDSAPGGPVQDGSSEEQADPEFLKSLSEFDRIVTGEKVQET